MVTATSIKQQSCSCARKWIGEPVFQKDGKVHYAAVQVDDQLYHIGSCAYFKKYNDTSSHEKKHFLGRIVSLFEGTWMIHYLLFVEDGKQCVECVWYLYPQDIAKLDNSLYSSRQVFLSNIRDITSVDSLKTPEVEVLSFMEFKQRESQGTLDTITISNSFSRNFYGSYLFLYRIFLDAVSTD